jgi:hypothetical protein
LAFRHQEVSHLVRRDYASVADFADPDGNTWMIQEIGYRPPRDASGGQPLD